MHQPLVQSVASLHLSHDVPTNHTFEINLPFLQCQRPSTGKAVFDPSFSLFISPSQPIITDIIILDGSKLSGPKICNLSYQRLPQTQRAQNDRCANYQRTRTFGTELHGSRHPSGIKVFPSCSRGGSRDRAVWQQVPESNRGIPLQLQGGNSIITQRLQNDGCANYQRTGAFDTELHGSNCWSGILVFPSCSRGGGVHDTTSQISTLDTDNVKPRTPTWSLPQRLRGPFSKKRHRCLLSVTSRPEFRFL